MSALLVNRRNQIGRCLSFVILVRGSKVVRKRSSGGEPRELIDTLPAYRIKSLGIDRYSARLYRIKSHQKPDSNRFIPKIIEKALMRICNFFDDFRRF